MTQQISWSVSCPHFWIEHEVRLIPCVNIIYIYIHTHIDTYLHIYANILTSGSFPGRKDAISTTSLMSLETSEWPTRLWPWSSFAMIHDVYHAANQPLPSRTKAWKLYETPNRTVGGSEWYSIQECYFDHEMFRFLWKMNTLDHWFKVISRLLNGKLGSIPAFRPQP